MRSLWKAGVAAFIALELLLAGCGDTYRPTVNPIVRPGGDPSNFDEIIVLNQNPNAALPGSFSEINIGGDTMSSNKSVGKDPVAVVLDLTRVSIFVANYLSDTVSASAVSAASVITLNLMPGSRPVAVTGLRQGRVYSANSGATSDCANGSVGIIDATNAVLLSNVCLPSPPKFLIEAAGNNRKLYAICADGKIRVISIDSAAIIGGPITVGTNPVTATLSLDQTQIYVLNQGSNDISVIDIVTDTVVTSSIAVGGTGPTSFALDQRLNRLYVANTGSNSVTILDAGRSPMQVLRTVTGSATPPDKPILSPVSVAVRADGSFAYVANSGANYITEIDANSFQTSPINAFGPELDPTIAATLQVTSTAISKDGSKVYASVVEPTNRNNGTSIVRTSDHTPIVTLAAPLVDILCDTSVTGNTCSLDRQRPTVLQAR